jgi:IclR family acetate operon transcriptional repressor
VTDTAVEKTLAVLEAPADHSRLTDIARVTGLPKSTVHRLLRAMVNRGFAAVDTVERARPALRALREDFL